MKFLPDQLKKILESVVSGIVVSLNLEFQIKSHLLSDQQKKPFGFLKSFRTADHPLPALLVLSSKIS